MVIVASQIQDVVVSELVPAIGLPAVIAALFAVIVLETVLLKLLRWDASWLRCLTHATLINLATTAVGMLILLPGDQPLLSRQSQSATVFAVFGIAFVTSWIVEGFLLKLLKRDGAAPFVKSFIINIASYILLLALVLTGFNQ